MHLKIICIFQYLQFLAITFVIGCTELDLNNDKFHNAEINCYEREKRNS